MREDLITEPQRSVPVVHEADLCVVGGSCTGVFAAVRAARLGLSVALIENNGFFGGTATAGLVHVWHSLFDTAGERQVISGLTAELLERLGRRGATAPASRERPRDETILNTEELKVELDELVREHRAIRPFLHTRFVAPVAEGGRVQAVILEDKTGRRAVRSRLFIDATGDGDVAARAGFPWEIREGLQPATVVAVWDNYDEILRRNPGFDLSAVVHDPGLEGALTDGFLWGKGVPGRPHAFMVAGTRAHHADCSDADQLTHAEMDCRLQVRRMMDILRRSVPGGELIALANLSAAIGIRETRHLRCLHTLSEEEVLTGKRFPDAIANGTYPVDIHYSDRPGITFKWLDGRQAHVAPGRPPVTGRWREEAKGVTPFYQIPYRSLVPAGSENLLAAGRLIGADPGAYGAIRVMVNCNQTGEAAGVAAAIAVNSGCSVRDVPADRLREILRQGGSTVV